MPTFNDNSSRRQQKNTHAGMLSSTTLSHLGGPNNVCMPSTLNYKERTELRRKDAFEYGRIYNHTVTRGMSVYDRLTSDASVRQTLKAASTAAASQHEGSFAAMSRAAAVTAAATAAADAERNMSSSRKQVLSGFVHNNNPNITCSLAAGEAACSMDPPLSALHPITLRSYYKKYPMEFLAAARPHVRTTNETMRMLGTYSGDQAVAQRLGVHIAHGSSCAALTRQ